MLLVIVDEYLELFANHKKWIDLIIHIGQEGRGANVFFMLGGQRLDLEPYPTSLPTWARAPASST
ncbi:ESX conserved componant EccC2 [Mycobacterium tuberculosis]|nr:ESX conserved componant EccC2 [Mycobacterium tuberculosis]CKN20725.1 ESX conserved componant EccC2 [Mycobacterium tuberculosis]